MGKLTVIEGGRKLEDRRLVDAERKIHKLAKGGAAITLEGRVLLELSRLGLRLTQILFILGRCRVRNIEVNADSHPEIYCVYGTMLESWEDQRIVREFALKVIVIEPGQPGRMAVIDIGRLEER